MSQQKYEDIIPRNKYVEELLINVISNQTNSTNSVLFYGQAGVGKSTFSKSLYHRIKQYYSDCTILNLEYTFSNIVELYPANAALLYLRNNLLKSHDYLNCFDIVYLICNGLGNSSIDNKYIGLPDKNFEENYVLKIIEIVQKGLYQVSLPLEPILSKKNFVFERKSKYISFGSYIFASLNWFFMQQEEEICNWWKLKARENLQELKGCQSLKDICELLPLFLARDLELHLQNSHNKPHKKAVIFIDNYEYFTDAEGKCDWLEKLIKLNSSILWVIFAEKPVDLANNTQNIPISNLTNGDSQAITQKFGIENSDISSQIIQASEGIPLYLLLGIETYLNVQKRKAPQREDFATNLPEILPKLNAGWDWYERKIWQILSNCRSWDKVLFAKLMSQFEMANCDWICHCWDKLFNTVVKSSFVELNADGVFRLHPIMGDYLSKNQPEDLQQSVNNWLFEYYQGEYEQSNLQLSALQKSLEHGLKSQHQQKTINWFLEHTVLQQKAGRHLFVISSLQTLLQSQENILAFILLSKSFFALEDYQQAVIALQTAQKLWETNRIKDNLELSTIQLQLAFCYFKLQRTSEANTAAQKALNIRINNLDEKSVEIAEVLKLQAGIAVMDGDYSKAFKFSQQALQIFESHQNIKNLQISQNKLTIAWLNGVAKNFDRAQLLLKQTLDNIADETHPIAIFCHEMLGNIYQSMGYFKYQEAYEEYKLALENAEINLGLTHPQTLQLITAIINFSRIRGEYDTVDILTQRRHANMEISNFEPTPAVADRLNKIGCLLYQQGRYDFSERLLQQALQINCKVLSEQHPQTAESFHNLGLIYKTQKRYYTAEVYFKQALQIRSQLFGEHHPATANSLNSLATLYCCMGKYQQAKPLLEQALDICENNFGEMHPHTATTLNNLAQMYLCQELPNKAEPIFEQALEICVSVLGKDHPYTKTVESNLSRLQDISSLERREEGLNN